MQSEPHQQLSCMITGFHDKHDYVPQHQPAGSHAKCCWTGETQAVAPNTHQEVKPSQLSRLRLLSICLRRLYCPIRYACGVPNAPLLTVTRFSQAAVLLLLSFEASARDVSDTTCTSALQAADPHRCKVVKRKITTAGGSHALPSSTPRNTSHNDDRKPDQPGTADMAELLQP